MSTEEQSDHWFVNKDGLIRHCRCVRPSRHNPPYDLERATSLARYFGFSSSVAERRRQLLRLKRPEQKS